MKKKRKKMACCCEIQPLSLEGPWTCVIQSPMIRAQAKWEETISRFLTNILATAAGATAASPPASVWHTNRVCPVM